jgi:hypothetical protein
MRGSYWYDFPGGAWTFTFVGPNSPVPDNLRISSCPATANRPDLNLPCVPVNGNTEWTGARSRHPSGLQVTLCDASVHFISNSIGLNEWRALGSIGSGDQVTF